MRRVVLWLVALVVALQGCAHPLSRLAREAAAANPGEYITPQRTTRSCTAVATRLDESAARLGITIRYDDTIQGGYTDFTSTITLEALLQTDVCGRVETLAHELGHVLQPMHVYGPKGQVFADGVSYLIVRAHAGYDPVVRYAPYLARFNPYLSVLQDYRRQIEVVAAELIRGAR